MILQHKHKTIYKMSVSLLSSLGPVEAEDILLIITTTN